MKWIQSLIPTVKEVPAEAEVPSHQLMIRSGMIRKLASGTYSYLPLGWRSLRKVIQIVREEMDKAGAQEMLLPAVQPIELWQKTGRDEDYGETMCRFKDRHGRINVLAPTAEEVITHVAAHEINSYKQLPINLYQISFKFRDEFRPRFGVLRSREFMMKDSYSFHADPESLEETYQLMYRTYEKIFQRCGLTYVIVEAESGEMGGSGSHQFTVPCQTGEDIIVSTEDRAYAANIEKAPVDPLPKKTPVETAPAMEPVHTPGMGSIEEICAFLKTQPQDMIKTLIYTQQINDQTNTIAILLRGDHEANPEKIRQALGGGHIDLADEQTVTKATGAAVGFAGPMGLAEKVSKMIIDHGIAAMEIGVTGANKTDYHTKNIVPGRDFPLQGQNILTADIRNAQEGDTYNGQKLIFEHGIEVGQVFKLGRKYSEKLSAKFLDEQGKEQICLMGCYGIGINRILASAIEAAHDDNGIVWPVSIAPFEVLITSLNQDDEQVAETAGNLYQKLLSQGIDVLLDDRPLRPGVKFKDADLIGIPVRVTVGKKGLAGGIIEIKLRRDTDRQDVPVDQAAQTVTDLVKQLYQEFQQS